MLIKERDFWPPLVTIEVAKSNFRVRVGLGLVLWLVLGLELGLKNPKSFPKIVEKKLFLVFRVRVGVWFDLSWF